MLNEFELEKNSSSTYFLSHSVITTTLSQKIDISAHVVQNFSQLKKVFSLVNKQYIREGYAEQNSSGLRYSIHNLLPVTTTFIASVNNSIVGTLSTVIDSSAGLPCSGDFSDELENLRSHGHKIAECTMFACEREDSLPSMEIHLELTKQIFKWCTANDIRYLCHVVNPKHVTFWKKQFGFKIVTGVRTCSHVCKNPGVFMSLDLEALRNGTTKLAPLAKKLFINCISHENLLPSNSHKLNKEEIDYLIAKEPEILVKASKNQSMAFMEYYQSL